METTGAGAENLRAALSWLIGQEEGELALRLSAALWRFWDMRGYWREGWRWLEAALVLPQVQAQTARRAKALHGAGALALRSGYPAAHLLLAGRSHHRREDFPLTIEGLVVFAADLP